MRPILPLLLTLLTVLNVAAASKPNIVFIFADDWGWGDLGCHGHPHLKTPRLDRLAKEGADFHQFVVCSPVCSPSRTAIVTGQYPARHRVHQHFASHAENKARGMPDWLDPKTTLLPRLLKEAGYATAHYGKWHLSGQGKDIAAPLPVEYGYDDAAGWTGPGRDVFEGTGVTRMRGTAHDGTGAAFLTIAATEQALRFIRAAKERPFYVNLWIHETHHLVAATEEDKREYPDTAEPQRTYYSAVTRADKQIGRVLDLLDDLNVADNTIVMFSSDNGPENSMPNPGDKLYFSVGDTGGLRGRKRSLFMGGVNVPFIVRWPGHVPAGHVDKTSVIAGVDVMPTLLAAAGVAMPPNYRPDGVNVLAALQGKPLARPQPLFWEWRGPNAKEDDWPQFAMCDGFHTLLMTRDQQRIALYDLANDRAQQDDLSAREPERVRSMIAAIKAWRDTLPDQGDAPSIVVRRPQVQSSTSVARPVQDRSTIFKNWDKNADGILSPEEYRNGLAAKENADRRFKSFDANSDGNLSLEEFVTPSGHK